MLRISSETVWQGALGFIHDINGIVLDATLDLGTLIAWIAALQRKHSIVMQVNTGDIPEVNNIACRSRECKSHKQNEGDMSATEICIANNILSPPKFTILDFTQTLHSTPPYSPLLSNSKQQLQARTYVMSSFGDIAQ